MTKKHQLETYGNPLGPVTLIKPQPWATPPKGKKRGTVTGLSKSAATRGRRAMYGASAEWLQRDPIFITLTLPGYGWEKIDYRAAYAKWEGNLLEEYPGVWGFWRLGFQKRGAAHYHIALDSAVVRRRTRGKGGITSFRQEVAQSWHFLVGYGRDPVHLLAGTSVKSVPFVGLPEYMFKMEEDVERILPDPVSFERPPDRVGRKRFWGMINPEEAKKHLVVERQELSNEEATHYDRAFTAYWWPEMLKWAEKRGADPDAYIPRPNSVQRAADLMRKRSMTPRGPVRKKRSLPRKPWPFPDLDTPKSRPMTRMPCPGPDLEELRRPPRKRPLTHTPEKTEHTVLAIDLNMVHLFQVAHRSLFHNGRFTGGAYGFLTHLTKLLAQVRPAAVVVCDAYPPYFREDAYPQYKGHRAMPSDRKKAREMCELRKHVAQNKRIARELLDAIGIPVWCVKGCEADDLIGLLARQAGSVYNLVIRSVDSDVLQLLENPSVSLYDPKTREYCDRDAFLARYPGLASPKDFARMTALVGSHTHVPGVPGIGSVKALKIVSDPDRWWEVRHGPHKKLLKRNLQLATVPYPGIPKKLNLTPPPFLVPRKFDRRRLVRVAARYGISVTMSMIHTFDALDTLESSVFYGV